MIHPSEIQQNIPLAPFTTLKIGGPARFFLKAETEEQVVEAFEFAAQNELDVFVLGGGSNVLISDKGFDGLVLHVALKGITGIAECGVRNADFEDQSDFSGPYRPAQQRTSSVPQSAFRTPHSADPQSITAQAGEDWDAFVEHCVEQNLAGIECLSGIPGFVGGTPVQNVGAYGQEVSETIVSVRVYDRSQKEIRELTNAECGFKYRTSIFNTVERDRYVVLAVTYELIPDGKPKLVYRDLQNYLAEYGAGSDVTLKQTREVVLTIRRAKSMVIDEGDPNSRSAGSFFKNPIVSRERFAETAALAVELGLGDVPSFAVADASVKVPAAWLIERSGFHKGYRLGNAGISTKHSLAIINAGGAAADEIIELKNKIQSGVKEKFGIDLMPEPVFVGF